MIFCRLYVVIKYKSNKIMLLITVKYLGQLNLQTVFKIVVIIKKKQSQKCCAKKIISEDELLVNCRVTVYK